MTCMVALIVSSLLLASPPDVPWPPGAITVFDEDRLRRFDDDVANADFAVRVVLNKDSDELDINIGHKSFTLDELRRFFKFQRHQDFIVVTYAKNAPHGNLDQSLLQLKKYFHDAGYKRVLLTHGTSSGVIIHEDYRPEAAKRAD